jgi:hypothetical protein
MSVYSVQVGDFMICKVNSEGGNEAIEKVKEEILLNLIWIGNEDTSEEEVRDLLRIVGVRR